MIGDRRILSGEMHYARIPRAYWQARLDMAFAMGLNAISTYVFWNLHEAQPQTYDFRNERDVAHYVRLAGDAGLDVVLRPGPYVCAEWDFGGLPAWLLAGAPVGIRTIDPRFMEPVRRWLRRLGEELAPWQRTRGGPIVAVQLENEYGAFGNDPAYLQALREALDDAGFGDSPYFTIDQPRDLGNGALADLPIAATFGPGDPEGEFRILRTLRPDAPLLCGEYWAGWFDHWGEPHARGDLARQVADLEWMLRRGASVNIYMFHGGTNFGFTNGANEADDGAYQPDTTSYDYLAALDEAGRPTAKYAAFRETIAAATGEPLRTVPSAPRTILTPECALAESAAFDPLCRTSISTDRPCTMESLGQSFGYVRYRTILAGPEAAGTLEIDGLRDYAVVMLDGKTIAHLDRRLKQAAVSFALPAQSVVLDLLVENCGRTNYGRSLVDQRKGIAGTVRWNGRELLGWDVTPLPLDDLSGLQFTPEKRPGPAFFRGTLELTQACDTFLDTRELGKGVMFVNGRNAGRFWNVGPQQSLYIPGVWLRPGTNRIVIFDVMPNPRMFTRGTAEPIMSI